MLLFTLLVTGCSVSPERCDPSDSSFGLSLLCQGEYERRAAERRAEIEAAARRSEGLEGQLDALSDERRAMAETLGEHEARARRAAARVDKLREGGAASEQQLAAIETRLAELDTEVRALQAEQVALEETQPDPEIETRMAALREKELELEELLLDLET